MISISVDAMGGDFGPSVTIPGTLLAMQEDERIHVVFAGDSEVVQTELNRHKGFDSQRVRIEHAEQVVEMADAPIHALRRKRRSSMRIALNLLESNEVQACISAGNTGALMVTAKYVLNTYPGIERPAIIGQMPTTHGHVHMLDLGANVDSPPRVLLQFGIMGATFVKYTNRLSSPKVALLNIGSEDEKGTKVIKEAAELFRGSSLNFCGYIEGDGIYTTKDVDVIVCDGFLGNIALKTSEGVSKLIQHAMKAEFQQNSFRKISGLLAMPSLRGFRKRIDPRVYNGGALLGLRGSVFKSHGNADTLAYKTAIKKAVWDVEYGVNARIRDELIQLSDSQA